MSFSDLCGHQAPVLRLDIHVGEALINVKIKEIYPKTVRKKDRKEKRKLLSFWVVSLSALATVFLSLHSTREAGLYLGHFLFFCTSQHSVSLEIWFCAPLTDGRKKERFMSGDTRDSLGVYVFPSRLGPRGSRWNLLAMKPGSLEGQHALWKRGLCRMDGTNTRKKLFRGNLWVTWRGTLLHLDHQGGEIRWFCWVSPRSVCTEGQQAGRDAQLS